MDTSLNAIINWHQYNKYLINPGSLTILAERGKAIVII